MLAIAALVGVAAWLALRPRESRSGTPVPTWSWLDVPLRGPALTPSTGPTPPPPPGGEEPGVLEQAGAWFSSWFADDAPQVAYRSPAQWRALLAPEFRRWENEFGLPNGFLEAIAERESSFRHDIITCEILGGVGEKGLMQIWPKYHPDRGCTPLWSIEYAAGFFREHFNRYQSWPLAIMAWNWGSGNMDAKGVAAVPQKTKDYIAFIDRKVDLA